MKRGRTISLFMMAVMTIFVLANVRGANPRFVKNTPTTIHSPQSRDTLLSINDNPYRFSGSYCDQESSNYYLNARYYRPQMRSFISRDTYDLSNRYAYCGGDPISQADPNGHLPNWLGNLLGSKYLGLGLAALGGLGAIGAFAVAGGAAEVLDAGIVPDSILNPTVARIGGSLGLVSALSQGASYVTKGRYSSLLGNISMGTALLAAPFDFASLAGSQKISSYRGMVDMAKDEETDMDSLKGQHLKLINDAKEMINDEIQLRKDYERLHFWVNGKDVPVSTMENPPRLDKLTEDQKLMLHQGSRLVQGDVNTVYKVGAANLQESGTEIFSDDLQNADAFSEDLRSNTCIIGGRIKVITSVNELKPSYSLTYVGSSAQTPLNKLAVSIVYQRRKMIAEFA